MVRCNMQIVAAHQPCNFYASDDFATLRYPRKMVSAKINSTTKITTKT